MVHLKLQLGASSMAHFFQFVIIRSHTAFYLSLIFLFLCICASNAIYILTRCRSSTRTRPRSMMCTYLLRDGLRRMGHALGACGAFAPNSSSTNTCILFRWVMKFANLRSRHNKLRLATRPAAHRFAKPEVQLTSLRFTHCHLILMLGLQFCNVWGRSSPNPIMLHSHFDMNEYSMRLRLTAPLRLSHLRQCWLLCARSLP